LSVLQLRELARGGFIRLFVGSAVACVAILVAIWFGAPDDATAGLMLASALSVGAVVLAVRGHRRASAGEGVHRGIDHWARALAAVHSPTRVGVLGLEASGIAPRVLARRVADRLGRRGAVALSPDRRRLLWFEQAPFGDVMEAMPALAAGLARSMTVTEAAPDGRRALDQAMAAGLVRGPSGDHADEESLLAEFRLRFPEGLASSVDADGTAFAGLPPQVRKRLWRDALRGRRRSKLPFEITAFRPAGEVKLLFAVPRTSSRQDRIAWRARIEAANWCCAVGPNGIRSDGDSPQ
jgi:hypothetical protein